MCAGYGIQVLNEEFRYFKINIIIIGADMTSPAHAEAQIGHIEEKMRRRKKTTVHVTDFIIYFLISLLGQLKIQISIQLCRMLPGDVLRHIPLYHLVPAPAIGEEKCLGAVHCIKQEPGVIAVKGKAIAFIGILIVRLHCILETARFSHDRHRAIAHGNELCQSAGLKQRRHEQSVRTCIDLMCPALVIHNI